MKIMVFIILIIAAVVLFIFLQTRSEQSHTEAARDSFSSIDYAMSPVVEGRYVGSLLGVSQTKQAVYIRRCYTSSTEGRNVEDISTISFSQLLGVDIIVSPTNNGPATPYSECDLIIHYTQGTKEFPTHVRHAEKVSRALTPIIRQKVEAHNSAIITAAGENTKIFELTVLGETQPSSTPHRVNAYIHDNILRVEEIATLDNIKFQFFSASISLSDIITFEQIGDVHYTTDVSGGGSSLTGAIIGGVIAGGAGAIIGSRQAVTSTTRQIDDRATVLKYKNDTQISQILFAYDDYYLLQDLIK